jgi:hypothetical protein
MERGRKEKNNTVSYFRSNLEWLNTKTSREKRREMYLFLDILAWQ